MDSSGPSHKPGLVAQAMCQIASQLGMGYYTALNGDAWSPDYPGLDNTERERRLSNFARDCANRGISNWQKMAREQGLQLEVWPASKEV